MSAPPRLLSPFVRTRTRLTLSLGLVLAALTAALLPWWQADEPSPPQARKAHDLRRTATAPRDEAAAAADARRTGKAVVVDTATTATAMTWVQPDGQLRTQMAALPRRAKNAEGRWAPIDNRLRRTAGATDGLGIRPVNPAVPVRFADGTSIAGKTRANRSYVRALLTDDQIPPGETVLAETVVHGHVISYTWQGELPEPVLDGPRALYSEAMPGVDLLLVAREEGGFAQLLIVKDREAARNPALVKMSYGLRSSTAVFRYDTTASRILVLDPDGKEIGSVPTPFAWDSSGRDPEAPEEAPEKTDEGTNGETEAGTNEPRTSVAAPEDVLKLSGLTGIEPGSRQAPAPMELAGDGTGTARIDVKVGETGLLSDPEAQFPVFVDPTLNAGWQAWTVAYKPYPNTSFWNGTNFSSGTSDARVGHENETGGTARSYWRMKYSTTLKGATVTSAAFKVLNNHSWSCAEREFQFGLTGAISSGTTWNKKPGWTGTVLKQSFAHGWSSSDCPDAYESFDVKSGAQKGADSGWSTITFGMQASSEGDTQTWRKFKATSAELTVVYNRKPAVPSSVTSTPGSTCKTTTGGATVGKSNLVLSAKSTDPDGNLKGLRFRFWKSGASTPAGTLVTSLSSGKGTLTIPSSTLVDKGVYSWDVRAEDSGGLVSAYYPTSGNRCTVTVDGSAPPPPTVESDAFPEATDDGLTWATVKFPGTGAVTFTSPDSVKFQYGIDGQGWTDVTATKGTATIPALKPPHSGPNSLQVHAYDTNGNKSAVTNYTFYVQPGDKGDSPGDTGGDGIPDIFQVNGDGDLYNCVGLPGGSLNDCLGASYTSDKQLHPAKHWYNPTSGKAALITHYGDAYPGDGLTDLFAVTPDGTFWLYPGDGYGSFDIGKRIRILLPADAPAPASWTQIKAVGDIDGDGLPDLALRAGPAFWVLSGYTGATFRTATLMNVDAWARRDIVNVADINGDSVPDLLWRNLDNGNMYVRHGKPGKAGGVDLESLKLAGNSANGDVSYGTNWTEVNISTALGIPDVNNDGIPDIWARSGTDGQMRIYYPSKTNTNAPVKVALAKDWRSMKALG
ncbi:FG-GAP-like repeat-containing protein [Streptomyces sp. AK02-01A]|uniref:FG-GAP-like repeat-containing protein n=1 Tax=Streptomyces sp. AK02-01A TaxID=3028648 RepID=UPI0029AAB12B|nr:FG-GAP-like repeat-containing protein [Streptomyces sp. AK02-01A]MDX3855343.1 FG-GAP-like repeat-containing protein [Streptomyces sp. AK02-01A]